MALMGTEFRRALNRAHALVGVFLAHVLAPGKFLYLAACHSDGQVSPGR